MSKQRNLRKKRALPDEGEEDDTPEVQKELLEDLKLLQKQRKRVSGVDASRLLPAAAKADEEEQGQDNELMDAQYVKAVGTNKSQILDEDTHMKQFVERELAKRLGKSVDELEQKLSKHEQQELELYQLPAGLKATLTQDVSLPGMMTAITEVEVSKEAKMRKIEETEVYKSNMLAKRIGREVEGAVDDSRMNVRRGQFAFSFGKQQKQQLDIDPEQLREQRKYITERTKDPKDIARMQKKRQQR